MFRVLLVDDEPRILKGISKTFHWEERGFEVIGEISDPVKAYETICNDRPDVVFTDLRMPELSGIDLIRMTREKGLDIEFIIISGYAEFEYAKEALKSNAFDYLLKPLDREEADIMLQRLSMHLKDKLDKTNHDINMLKVIFDRNDCNGALEDVFTKRGFNNTHKYFRVMLFISEQLQDLSIFTGTDSLNIIDLKLGLHRYLFIMNGTKDCLEGLHIQMEKIKDPEHKTIALSSISDQWNDVPELVREADIAILGRFFHYTDVVFIFEKKNNQVIKGIIDKIIRFINQNEYFACFEYVDSLPGFFINNHLNMESLVNLWNYLASVLIQKYENLEMVHDIEFMDYRQIVQKYGDINCFFNYVKDLIKGLMEVAARQTDIQVNDNFRQLVQYVDLHYPENISLKELADKFFISFAYCCVLFKKVTGKTYSEYITALRMKKAGELLKNRLLSVSEAGFESGYEDYYYFNKVFKKYYGVTPLCYRKKVCI